MAGRKQKVKKAAIDDLLEVMSRLRAPDGCPWDREQDHRSIRLNAVEEVYELVDAIEAGDDTEMEEELGDLLLQVVFHAQMASERGAFDFEKVARNITDKLVRRHPHVFGPAADAALDVAAVEAAWDRLKAEEKGRSGPFDGIPASFPPRLAVAKVERRAAAAGIEVDFGHLLAALDAAEEAVRAEVRRVVGRGAG